MSRGYLKTVGDRKRLRLVKAGYDANSESVPFDAVLFDSDSDGMGSIIASGTVNLGAPSGGYLTLTGSQVVSWSFPFVPLCFFSFNRFNFGYDNTLRSRILAGTGFLANPAITVRTTGITVRGSFDGINGVPIYMNYVALRVNAI